MRVNSLLGGVDGLVEGHRWLVKEGDMFIMTKKAKRMSWRPGSEALFPCNVFLFNDILLVATNVKKDKLKLERVMPLHGCVTEVKREQPPPVSDGTRRSLDSAVPLTKPGHSILELCQSTSGNTLMTQQGALSMNMSNDAMITLVVPNDDIDKWSSEIQHLAAIIEKDSEARLRADVLATALLSPDFKRQQSAAESVDDDS